MTPEYLVHVNLGPRALSPNLVAIDGRTYEASNLDDALGAVKEAVTTLGRDWKSITIVHIEDMPALMRGAIYQGRGLVGRDEPDE